MGEEKAGKEKKEVRFCKDCKSYDKSSERQFHRDGIKKGLVEVRAVCRNPKARSFGHLVMAEYSKRQCPQWEPGVYEPPKIEKPNMPAITDEMKVGDIVEWKHPETKEMLTFKVVRVGTKGRRLVRQKEQPQSKETKKETEKSTKKSRKQKSTVIVNPLNGEVATLEKRGCKTVIVKA